MRIDLPLCSFKDCRYFFDGNCTNKNKYESCDYQLAKIEAIKEFADILIEIGTKEGAYDYVSVFEIDNITKELIGD